VTSRSVPIRVVHIITGLDLGGAEMMLYNLLAATDRSRIQPAVVSLIPPGDLAGRIADLGIAVQSLGMRRGVPHPAAMVRLARMLRRLEPDLVHTWMYHADLLGGLAARFSCGAPVIWALHNSTLDPAEVRLSTRLTARTNALLSHVVPTRIVSCSQASMKVHRDLGYASGRLVGIPNGFDLHAFRPEPSVREAVRVELGVAPDTRLVGSFARFHPQKDHRNLCHAAGLIAAKSNAHFVLAGSNIDSDNVELGAWIAETGFAQRFHLLGAREDIPRLTAALDIAVVASSFGEAFPLVVGEAMACAVPCVVTDVGDSTLMVGDTGRVVPPRDPDALAAAVLDLLSLPDETLAALGQRARARIEARFALPAIAARYEQLYVEVLAGRPPKPGRS
jgi:glycosyltransferase involved in cell wall biosynthesis